jgi:transposase InsO family protein
VVRQAVVLQPTEQRRLKTILRDFKKVFKLKTDPPGLVNNYEVDIVLETEEPICQRQYPLTYDDKEEVRKQTAEMEAMGVIEVSDSPWNSPVIFVNKKIVDNEGTSTPDRRMCVDLRALNLVTKKVNFPIPTVDSTIQNLTGSKFFSSLDVLSGFWHLPMSAKSQQYLAFSTPWNHFQFKRLPFGWVNSPFHFQRYMQTRIANRLPEFVQVYIDDIVIFSKTKEEHFEHIQAVLQVIQEEGLHLKTSKCSFFNHEMEYLGHIISEEGIRKDPRKVAAIEQLRPPTTKKQLRSFLGKVNYYGKFLPQLSQVARPLAKMTGSKTPFQWGPAQQTAFEEIKMLIVEKVVLAFPDVNQPYNVITDASDYAIGGVLAQKDPVHQIERPVMFISKALSERESRYSVSEKELYAIIHALEKFRPYIFGRTFDCTTDHRALTWLCGKKNPSGRLGRWCNAINQYARTIKFIQGKENRVADALSRAPFVPEPESNQQDSDEEDGGFTNPCLHEDLKSQIRDYAKDNELIGLYALANLGNWEDLEEEQAWEGSKPDCWDIPYTPILLPSLWSKEPAETSENVSRNEEGSWIIHVWEQGSGEQKEVLWVPPLYRKDVMKAFHRGPTTAHPSAEKMMALLKPLLWWKGCTKDVEQFVKQCHQCQLKRRGGNDHPQRCSRNPPSHPWQRISMDVLSMKHVSGNAEPLVLIILDEFTRFPEAYPIRHEDAPTIADKFVTEFITRYGIPEEVLTDRGGSFVGKLFSRICAQLRIKKLNTTAYRPQGNGANERMHGTLYTLLRNLTNETGSDWRKKLPYALHAYRTAKHSALGMSPYQALFGHQARNVHLEKGQVEASLDLDDRISKLQDLHKILQGHMHEEEQKRNEKYNAKHKTREYQKGDYVKIRRHVRNKMQAFWDGPYRVMKKTGPVTYEIDFAGASQAHPKIHCSHLRPWIPNQPDDEDDPEKEPETSIPQEEETNEPGTKPDESDQEQWTSDLEEEDNPASNHPQEKEPKKEIPRRPITRMFRKKHHIPWETTRNGSK